MMFTSYNSRRRKLDPFLKFICE
uniref:Uncharacterized protein n=1 Tax=Tetranychus urticae TaxID=32264 RepID=T1KN03_TETUR